VGYRLLQRVGFFEGAEGFEVLGGTTTEFFAVAMFLNQSSRYEYAVQALWPGGVWGLLSEASVPLAIPTVTQLCPMSCGCSAACSGPCLATAHALVPDGKPAPLCARFHDGCPTGLLLDRTEALCVDSCPPSRSFLLNSSRDQVSMCADSCPSTTVADGRACAEGCSAPGDVLILHKDLQFFTCSPTNASLPHVELHFNLDFDSHQTPAQDFALRLVRGLAKATTMPTQRFGVMEIRAGSIIADVVINRFADDEANLAENMALEIWLNWTLREPVLINADPYLFRNLVLVRTVLVPAFGMHGMMSPPPPPRQGNSATVVACSVVPLGLIFLAGFAVLWWYRRKGKLTLEHHLGFETASLGPKGAWEDEGRGLCLGDHDLDSIWKDANSEDGSSEVPPLPVRADRKPPVTPSARTWVLNVRKGHYPVQPSTEVGVEKMEEAMDREEAPRRADRSMTSIELVSIEEGSRSPDIVRLQLTLEVPFDDQAPELEAAPSLEAETLEVPGEVDEENCSSPSIVSLPPPPPPPPPAPPPPPPVLPPVWAGCAPSTGRVTSADANDVKCATFFSFKFGEASTSSCHRAAATTAGTVSEPKSETMAQDLPEEESARSSRRSSRAAPPLWTEGRIWDADIVCPRSLEQEQCWEEEDDDDRAQLNAELAELLAIADETGGACVAVPPARGHAPWVLEAWQPADLQSPTSLSNIAQEPRCVDTVETDSNIYVGSQHLVPQKLAAAVGAGGG